MFTRSDFYFVARLFLAFLIYSFIGWAYESFVWAICEKKRFINRGFLAGPICPIYGIVCVLDYFLLYKFSNPITIFFTASIVCCCAEYAISYALEKVFKSRWWDYSNYAFNLNGRISLYSGFLFGLCGLLLVKIVHPFVMENLLKVEIFFPPLIVIFAITLFVGLLIDLLTTIFCMKGFGKKIFAYRDAILEKSEKSFDFLNEHYNNYKDSLFVKKGHELLATFETFNEKMMQKEEKIKKSLSVLKSHELRFISAFPDFKFKFGNSKTEKTKERAMTKIIDGIKSALRPENKQ